MGQMRDWNEELQSARELPTDTPQLKLFRDRTIYKVRHSFCVCVCVFLSVCVCVMCAYCGIGAVRVFHRFHDPYFLSLSLTHTLCLCRSTVI